jgi:hypothetical protein
VCLGCLARIALFPLGHSLMVLSRSWGYKLKDCGVFKEHGSLFFQDYICGMWLFLGGKWIEDVKGYELSVFFKVKQTFVTSLHLISKEPDLESDLLLPSSGTSWGLSRFWV